MTFDLTNEGATLAPDSLMQVDGNLVMNSGALEIAINSAEEFDTLVVEGHAQLGGQLRVALEGYVPEANDVFEIITADNCIGTFENAIESGQIIDGTLKVDYQGDAVVLYGYQGDD